MRAKITALSQRGLDDTKELGAGRARHGAYLDYARRSFARRKPVLVLVSGLSGSGKTWLAERLAPALGAVHLRSDVERKRLAGLTEFAQTGSLIGQGLYSGDFTMRVYEHLADAAEDVLAGGYTAIVDATFSRREDRDVFHELVSQSGIATYMIHCHAPQEVLKSRVAGRGLHEKDASEADVAVLEWQKERWEPVETDEKWAVISVETAHVELDELAARITALHGHTAP